MNKSLSQVLSLFLLTTLQVPSVFAADCDVKSLSPEMDRILLPNSTLALRYAPREDSFFQQKFAECLLVKDNNVKKTQECYESKFNEATTQSFLNDQKKKIADIEQAFKDEKIQWIGVQHEKPRIKTKSIYEAKVQIYNAMKKAYTLVGISPKVVEGVLSLTHDAETAFFANNPAALADSKIVYLSDKKTALRVKNATAALALAYESAFAELGIKFRFNRKEFAQVDDAAMNALLTSEKISPEDTERLKKLFKDDNVKAAIEAICNATNLVVGVKEDTDTLILETIKMQQGAGFLSIESDLRESALSAFKKGCSGATSATKEGVSI